MEKHKHADLIHAWADGAKIEKKWADTNWVQCSLPVWYPHEEYRIKPEPVVDYMYVTINSAIWSSKYEGNLKLIFDGNGKLKSAEVIK